MSLRQAAQQALEALEWNYNTDLDNIPACEQWAKMLNETITALKQALAELDSDYERGFVDGMNLQTKRSVDKAVNRMAQTTHWEGCEAVHPECKATPRKPLTDDEIVDIWAGVSMGYDDQINIIELARAVIAAYEAKQGEQT